MNRFFFYVRRATDLLVLFLAITVAYLTIAAGLQTSTTTNRWLPSPDVDWRSCPGEMSPQEFERQWRSRQLDRQPKPTKRTLWA